MPNKEFDILISQYEAAQKLEHLARSNTESAYERLLNKRNEQLIKMLQIQNVAICTDFETHVGSYFPNRENGEIIDQLKLTTKNKGELLGLFPINKMRLVLYEVESVGPIMEEKATVPAPKYKTRAGLLCPFHHSLLLSKIDPAKIIKDEEIISSEIEMSWTHNGNKLPMMIDLGERIISFADRPDDEGKMIVVDEKIYRYFGLSIQQEVNK